MPRPKLGVVVHTESPTNSSPGQRQAAVGAGLVAVPVHQQPAGQHVGDRPGAGRVGPLREPRDGPAGRLERRRVPQVHQVVCIVNPKLQMPAVTQFARRRADRARPLFPFLFITIACGAISGFHALSRSGTTPKMLDKETRHPHDRLRRDADARAGRRDGADRRLLAASRRLLRHQRRRPRKFADAGHGAACTCRSCRAQVGETLAGRTGGAVSLAVGMAQIFTGLPGMKRAARVLVPLRDHVRGAVHPHHDRHRHARRRAS